MGGILRQLRQANIQCKFEAEELATRQNYDSEKELVWDSIKVKKEIFPDVLFCDKVAIVLGWSGG